MENPSEILRSRRTMLDFDRLQAEFDAAKEAQRQKVSVAAASSLPATVRIANEIEGAIQSGDLERANLLHQVHKTMDKGILPYGYGAGQPMDYSGLGSIPPMSYDDLSAPYPAQGGTPAAPLPPAAWAQMAQQQPAYMPQAMPGYGEAIGSIEATKKGMGRQAEKRVDLYMNPQITRAESDQRNLSDLNYKPQIDYASKTAQEIGKKRGENETLFAEMNARMPQLEDTTTRLSALGKMATYTMSGQAWDALSREVGLPIRDAATARAEYVSMVDNEILPLLRQTFGAQFTEREGESLKATLGSPNRSPQEKDAVLRSFIRTKMETVNSLAREMGYEEPYSRDYIQNTQQSIGNGPAASSQTPKKGNIEDGYMFLGGDPSDPKNWKKAK